MVCVPIISIAAFIIILWNLNWKWIEMEDKMMFAHSIFGIVAIGLSLIQVCEFKNKKDNLESCY